MNIDDSAQLIGGALFILWGLWIVIVGISLSSKRILVFYSLWALAPFILPSIALILVAVVYTAELSVGVCTAITILFLLKLIPTGNTNPDFLTIGAPLIPETAHLRWWIWVLMSILLFVVIKPILTR